MIIKYFRRGKCIDECEVERVPLLKETVFFTYDKVACINLNLPADERLSKTDVYKVTEIMTVHDVNQTYYEVELEFLR